jgi:methionine sulfoxide reductase heme-binding subunit
VASPVRWLAVACFGASLAIVLPPLLEGIDGSSERPLLWYAGRATGFVSYVALWASLFTGSLVSARGVDGLISRRWLIDFHQQWTLAAILSVAAHVVVLVGHSYSDITLIGALVPYASDVMRAELGLGAIALWGLVLIASTSWLRTRIPYAWWRSVHALAFGMCILAFAHALQAGSDALAGPAQALYLITAALAVGAIVARALVALARRSGQA